VLDTLRFIHQPAEKTLPEVGSPLGRFREGGIREGFRCLRGLERCGWQRLGHCWNRYGIRLIIRRLVAVVGVVEFGIVTASTHEQFVGSFLDNLPLA
jgi:hypothetical protein